jgi:hypothetical protein
VDKVKKIVEGMRASPSSVRFLDRCAVCERYFGAARQQHGSHRIYKTPWAGDPRVNIQKGDGGKAKPYQVKQVLAAIARLEEKP